MKIYYRKSDKKFCGAGNIDKILLGEDDVLSINIKDNEWLSFIKNAQEIYIEDEKLVSKETVYSLDVLKERKLQKLKAKTAKKIMEKYSIEDQLNIGQLRNGFNQSDLDEMNIFITSILDDKKIKKEKINNCTTKTALNKVEV